MTESILVTGASRGIGFETCRALVKNNTDCNIVMVARDSEVFTRAAKKLRSETKDCKVIKITADLSNKNSVESIFEEIEKHNINLTAIVNNAGFTKPAPINEISTEDFELTMRINLFTPFELVKTAILRSHPLENVVNIASTAGIEGRAGWLTYSASKAALINMSEVMRKELAPLGVRITTLSPGRCATDLRRTLAPEEDPTSIMQAHQVADVVRLMTTEAGRVLMSQNLVVRT